MTRPVLYCGRSDRLTARLKQMLYAWRFIEQVGGQCVVQWQPLGDRFPEENIGYTPDQIFDLDVWRAAGGEERLRFELTEISAPAGATELDTERFRRERKMGFDRATFEAGGDFFMEGTAHFFFAGEAEAEVDAGVRALFRELPIRADVRAEVDAFMAENGLVEGGFDAVHVRRGDVYDFLHDHLAEHVAQGGDNAARLDKLMRQFVRRSAPMGCYDAAVQRATAAGRRIAFASDSPEVIEGFRERHGAEHFVDIAALGGDPLIRKAFMDFLVLTRAGRVIGTSSNYSTLAAVIAGAPLEDVSQVMTGDIVVAEIDELFLPRAGLSGAEAEKVRDAAERAFDSFGERRGRTGRRKERRAKAVAKG